MAQQQWYISSSLCQDTEINDYENNFFVCIGDINVAGLPDYKKIRIGRICLNKKIRGYWDFHMGRSLHTEAVMKAKQLFMGLGFFNYYNEDTLVDKSIGLRAGLLFKNKLYFTREINIGNVPAASVGLGFNFGRKH